MTPGEIWRRTLLLFRRDRASEDLEDEMRLHLALRAERNREAGMSATEAERAARRRFGNRPALAEASHDSWGLHWADVLAHDLRYAIRGLRRSPGLTLMVVITLALGLGVNGAIFSLIDRVFVRPPAGITDPGHVRRVYVTENVPISGMASRGFIEYTELMNIESAATPSTTFASYSSGELPLGHEWPATTVGVAWTGAAYFSVLGVRFARGRPFAADEERIDGAPAVAIVSDHFWQRELGGDSLPLGRAIEVDHRRYTIIGVIAAGFRGVDLDAVDVWLPLGLMSAATPPAVPWYKDQAYELEVLARLGADASDQSLGARATVAYRRGAKSVVGWHDSAATVTTGPVLAALGPVSLDHSLVISTRLEMVALLVLIIACANVGNLLVVRALRRRHEIAVRLALGISRRRLFGQLLTEGFLLSLPAAAIALLVSAWVGAALRALLLPEIQWTGSPVDFRVGLLILGVAMVTGVTTGLAPVVQSRRFEFTDALKSNMRGRAFGSSALRVSLITTQSALAVVLLAGAGIFIQSLRHVTAIDLGYDVDHLIFASIWFDRVAGASSSAQASEVDAGLREAAIRLRQVPGIEQTALANAQPMGGFTIVGIRPPSADSSSGSSGSTARRAGQAPLPANDSVNTSGTTSVSVSPEYFSATGMHLERGRTFVSGDSAGPQVVVVSQLTARLLWPAENPLGKCIRLNTKVIGPCFTVVGVVNDVHATQVIEPPKGKLLRMYFPLSGHATSPVLIVRASPANAKAATEATRAELRRLFSTAAQPSVVSMNSRLAPELRPWQLGATLFSALGILALVLAGIGLYSVVSYSVSQRTHELGVRITLGAQRRDLLTLVLNEGLRTVAGGLVLGVILAIAMGRVVESMLYETSPRDPVVMVAVTLTLLSAAGIASLVPALRASRVNPLDALRAE